VNRQKNPKTKQTQLKSPSKKDLLEKPTNLTLKKKKGGVPSLSATSIS